MRACVLQVVAAANQQLQQLVQAAQLMSASGGDADMAAPTALRTSISKLAAVQQDDMTVSIKAIADKVAANSSYDASADLASFAQVRPSGLVLYQPGTAASAPSRSPAKVQRRTLQLKKISFNTGGFCFSQLCTADCACRHASLKFDA